MNSLIARPLSQSSTESSLRKKIMEYGPFTGQKEVRNKYRWVRGGGSLMVASCTFRGLVFTGKGEVVLTKIEYLILAK